MQNHVLMGKRTSCARVAVYVLMAMMGAVFLIMLQFMLKERSDKMRSSSDEENIIINNDRAMIVTTQQQQQEIKQDKQQQSISERSASRRSRSTSSSLNSEYEYWLRNYIIKSDPHLLACHNDIGFGLIERWRKSERVICGDEKNTQNSRVYMYRIQQTRHTAQDNFVRIRNFVTLTDGFFSNGFTQGWFTSGCSMKVDNLKSREGHNLFQMHLDKWMGQYQGERACSKKINRRVVFLQRDGEYNLFHSMTDFSSLFVNYLMMIFKRIEEEGIEVTDTMELLDEYVKGTDVVYLDGYQMGPYMPILQAFGSVFSYSEYTQHLKKEYEVKDKDSICFDEVLFATPGGSNFLFKDAWRPK